MQNNSLITGMICVIYLIHGKKMLEKWWHKTDEDIVWLCRIYNENLLLSVTCSSSCALWAWYKTYSWSQMVLIMIIFTFTSESQQNVNVKCQQDRSPVSTLWAYMYNASSFNFLARPKDNYPVRDINIHDTCMMLA